MKHLLRSALLSICIAVLALVCTPKAEAAELHSFLGLPFLESSEIRTEIVDLQGQSHWFDGVLDVQQLNSDLVVAEIERFRLWQGELCLLESSLCFEKLPTDGPLQSVQGEGDAPATLNGYYTAEFMMDDIHQVFLTGLTEDTLAQVQKELVASVLNGEEFTMTNIDFIDTEKEIVIATEDGTEEGDSLMCWAAATSNMLHYTGWAQEAGFQDEDEMFEVFVDYFDDHGGQYVYGLDWFFNGNNRMQTVDDWAHIVKDYGTFPGFFPEYCSTSNYISYDMKRQPENLPEVLEKLRSGYAVGVGFGFYTGSFRWGGHAVTLWGYVQDITKSMYDPEAYVACFLTDSDSHKEEYQPRRSAPNCLALMPMAPITEDSFDSWELAGYSNWLYTAILDGLTVLRPIEDAAGYETTGTKNRFNHSDLALEAVYASHRGLSGTKAPLFSAADMLDLVVEVGNAADPVLNWTNVTVTVLLEKDGKTLWTNTVTERLYLSRYSVGSIRIPIDQALTEGEYTVTATVSSSLTESYTVNNMGTWSFRVDDKVYDLSGVSFTAAVGEMTGEDGGIAELFVSGLAPVLADMGSVTYQLYRNYNSSDNWSTVSRGRELPQTCKIPANGDRAGLALVIQPHDHSKPGVVLYSNEMTLQYIKLNIWDHSDNIAECTPVEAGATALAEGEQFSAWAYNDSTADQSLEFQLAFYARRRSDHLEILLSESEKLVLESKRGTLFDPFECSSWELPLPAGAYSIVIRAEGDWGTLEKEISTLLVLGDEISVGSRLGSQSDTYTYLEVAAFAPEGEATVGVEYGEADAEKTKIKKDTATVTAEEDYLVSDKFSFNHYPGAKYRYRGFITMGETTTYEDAWNTFTAPEVDASELRINVTADIYSDQSSDELFFHFRAEKTGVYLLKSLNKTGNNYLCYATDRNKEWLYFSNGVSGVYRSEAISLEQGESLFLKLSTYGGEYSVGIFEPSLDVLGIPVLTDLWLGDCIGNVYVLAEAPYDTDCEYGIEYGLSREKTILKTKTLHTDSETIHSYITFDLVSEQPWQMRAYVKNLETGEIQYGQWETIQPKKGVQTDLSNGETVTLQNPSSYYYFMFTAPETGWYRLRTQTDYKGTLYRFDLATCQWTDFQSITSEESKQIRWEYLQAGETAHFRLYCYSGTAEMNVRMEANCVEASADGDTITVRYRPDRTGTHVIALYDSFGKQVAVRQCTVTDLTVEHKETFTGVEAEEVRVFQMDTFLQPLKSRMQAKIS